MFKELEDTTKNFSRALQPLLQGLTALDMFDNEKYPEATRAKVFQLCLDYTQSNPLELPEGLVELTVQQLRTKYELCEALMRKDLSPAERFREYNGMPVEDLEALFPGFATTPAVELLSSCA